MSSANHNAVYWTIALTCTFHTATMIIILHMPCIHVYFALPYSYPDGPLVSSLEGRRAALPREQLKFSCALSGNTLVWITSLIPPSNSGDFIGFIRSVDGEGTSYTLPRVGFVAVLTSKTNGVMNSTLQFTANQTFNGTDVSCTNGAFSPTFSKTIFVAGIVPLRSLIVYYTCSVYDQSCASHPRSSRERQH